MIYLQKKILLLICFVITFCSCRTIGEQSTTIPSSKETNFRTPTEVSEQVKTILSQVQEYKISPLDLLEISVYQEDDLVKIVRVSQNGEIAFPLIGMVKVAGLTVPEIEQKMAYLLNKDYIVNPQVSVFIKEYRSKKVHILGAVVKPGTYEFPYEQELTFMELIAQSGGFAKVAALDATRIIRTEAGIEKNLTVKVTDIIKKGDRSKDILLKPNDIIVVPETFF